MAVTSQAFAPAVSVRSQQGVGARASMAAGALGPPETAMPSAVTPVVYARHYGADPAAAVHVVVTTSLAAIITIPIIISLGRIWLGL